MGETLLKMAFENAFATIIDFPQPGFIMSYNNIKTHVDLLREKKKHMKKDIEKVEQILQGKDGDALENDTHLKWLAVKYVEYIHLCDAIIDGIDMMCSKLQH